MADSAICHLGFTALLGSRCRPPTSSAIGKESDGKPPADRPAASQSPPAQSAEQQAPATELVELTTQRAPAAQRPQVRGQALDERLKKKSNSARKFVTLADLRGSSGAAFEGSLRDISREDFAFCIGPLGRARSEFYAVKGPWMLKFRRNAAGAKSHGVPIPLDDADVKPVGDTDFEVSNFHVKHDYLGKGLSDMAGSTFVHSVQVLFAAPSLASRDAWVEALRAQIKKLADRQERKRRTAESAGAGTVGLTSTGTGAAGLKSHSSQKTFHTTATVAVVNGMAAQVFADFEVEEEFAVIGVHRPDLVAPFPAVF